MNAYNQIIKDDVTSVELNQFQNYMDYLWTLHGLYMD